MTSTESRQQEGLRRELGRWDLTAVGVNQTIGGAIFALAAGLAANTGSWAPWLVAAVAFASLLIALSFAEVGSRFDGTGGPYLYTRAAFGRFPAFEVGWMMWFTRAASWASVINVLVDALGRYWPVLLGAVARPLLLAGIITLIAAINIRGIRQSSFVVNVLTIAKVLPLVVFVAIGIAYVDWGSFNAPASMTVQQLSTGALILIFAFGGYEVVPVLGGETKDPRHAIPFALIMTIIVVAAITLMTQVVAFGTLPGIAQSKTPLADSAAMFMGAAGALMITVGAVLSTSGNNMGQALSGSRNLFALAEQGDLPSWFGRVHPRFRTPSNAIIVTAVVSFGLAVTGSFVTMAAASAISRLLVYVMTCAALLRLRTLFGGAEPHISRGIVVNPPAFVVPGGPIVPVLAIVIAAAIIFGATRIQLISGTGALVAGAVLYLIAVRGEKERLRE
ncbi:MAG TPA: APC family permease [Vicinamibacterales bacterium]|nr:APC family permease [Vicinamibacterales bacterium]